MVYVISRYRCDITYEMDKYLLHRHSYIYTYIEFFKDRLYIDGKEGNVYLFRVPGATRGCIKTDEEGIIESIDFYEDTCYGSVGCYRREVEGVKEEYIGKLLKLK